MRSRKATVVSVERAPGGLRRIRTDDGREFLARTGPGAPPLPARGAELDSDDLARLEGPAMREAGLVLAVHLLSRRDRTARQVRGSLSEAGIADPGVIDDIIATLETKGYIDDRRYAAELIAFRKEHRSAGPAMLRRVLGEAGVGRETAEDEVRRAFPPGEERRTAEEAAARRLAERGTGDRQRDARRMHGYLTRRGFSADAVGGICAAILRGERIGAGDEPDDTDGE
ncbi:MAG: RecX family transcriptional regulator [Candidatus Krumholzibacteria bacterium]|nr:RecX family transcriptional regulator [Candidatus Krumholzibacteria bacterium]